MKKLNRKQIVSLLVIIFLFISSFILYHAYFIYYKNTDKIKSDFSTKELEYFNKIAFNLEEKFVKNKKQKTRLQFWTKDLAVRLRGDYTKNDSLELVRIIEELNLLIDSINFKIVNNNSNVNIYFLSPSEFKDYTNNRLVVNWGYFRVRYNIHSLILINKYKPQKIRHHLLREELTQSLGLCNDTFDYPLSIFYKGYSSVTEYSEMDKKLIQLLYNYNLPYYYSENEFQKTYLSHKIQ